MGFVAGVGAYFVKITADGGKERSIFKVKIQ
jgi:hypothetical protein